MRAREVAREARGVQGTLIDDTIGAVRSLAVAASLVALAALTSSCNVGCKPQEASGTMLQCNGGARGYIWTGTSCIYTSLCNCTGPDCSRLYATQDGCETAHIQCR